MNYNQALEYIHSVEWLGSRPGLSRTQELLSKLGNPQEGVKFVHVAGTNGKGSTCAMLNSVLMQAGYRVGLYTSPYIVRFNERMCINGEPISDTELADLVEIIKPIADGMEDKPTEFEIITALAFLYFKKHCCDIVVLEVGMGGRLDSTNVIDSPVASVITGVAIDHTSVLGNTVEKIAFEKAGIIKYKRPVVYGGRDDTAGKVLYDVSIEKHAWFYRTNLNKLSIKSADINGTVFDYCDYKDVKISLLGTYQPENAATVIETVGVLNENGFKISDSDLRQGLACAKWRARFELLSNEPPVIFDGSHNIQGVTAAAESIKHFFGGERVALLMGVLADKDYEDMADILSSVADKVFAVTPDSPRALSSTELAKTFSSLGVEAMGYETVFNGVEAAYEYAKTQNIPLVMLGSLYMYGEVYNSFQKTANKRV
ncbi:MAG: bifunctional folylpolyglutamate synthase/dihydrofolate synthase [Ruminococcaceae bacterium]|nr:bifunctional folylpolyglutamate synthase/dihydrofolate synthase [Oscillospiraceae bacterium]